MLHCLDFRVEDQALNIKSKFAVHQNVNLEHILSIKRKIYVGNLGRQSKKKQNNILQQILSIWLWMWAFFYLTDGVKVFKRAHVLKLVTWWEARGKTYSTTISGFDKKQILLCSPSKTQNCNSWNQVPFLWVWTESFHRTSRRKPQTDLESELQNSAFLPFLNHFLCMWTEHLHSWWMWIYFARCSALEHVQSQN